MGAEEFPPPEDEALAHCDHPGCSATFKDHYWGSIEAGGKGWFMKQNGEKWCPEHVPDWVPAWRAKQEAKRLGRR